MAMAGYLSLLCALIIVLLTQYSHQDAPPRVQTKLGAVVGTSRESEEGKMIYSFMGIPYIKPPVGELRFKPPVPADPWTDDFSANSDMAICVQMMMDPSITVSEDCVMLNVHTPWNPSSAPSKPLSVMVFIHGGGFVRGTSGSLFSGYPDYLLAHDVVLVTVNYRLGIFGFLSTEDEAAPGNYGLLDQVEALKWVKNNIASFGGNPDEVTIFGESAGSASVHYLVLSPLAKGLFHRAIGQSGTVLSTWARTDIARNNAQALARKVGCPEQPSKDLLDCLRNIDATKLANIDIIEPDQRMGLIPVIWAPRIDSEAAEPFLPKHPVDLMISGDYNKVPFLLGHTRNEGGLFMIDVGDVYKRSVNFMTNKWDLYCKINLGTREFLLPEKIGSEMCNKVKEEYIDSSKNFEENKMAYTDLLGDAQFAWGVYKSSELMSTHNPVYNYLFNYEDEQMCLLTLFYPGAGKVDGLVVHADDLMYLFKYPQIGFTKESKSYEIVEIMTEIWTDFAKTGEPAASKLTTHWPKASWPDHKYVVIDTEPSIKQNYRSDKIKMLEEFFSTYLYKTDFSEKDEL